MSTYLGRLFFCPSSKRLYQPNFLQAFAYLLEISRQISPIFQNGPRVHFKINPQQIPEKKKSPPSSLSNGNGKSLLRPQSFTPGGLKRSKSLTSADALASGMAALGLAADAGDLGTFPAEIQECIDKALEGELD